MSEITDHSYGAREIVENYLSPGTAGSLLESLKGAGFELVKVEIPGHPENYCHRCGGSNVSWSAPSPLWNQVMRDGSINGEWKFAEIICLSCFAVLAEAQGIAHGWHLDPVKVHVELETVTPSGRVWDPERRLWGDSPKPAQSFKVGVMTTPYEAVELAITDTRQKALAGGYVHSSVVATAAIEALRENVDLIEIDRLISRVGKGDLTVPQITERILEEILGSKAE